MNLAERAYELIRDEIITCVLKPSQQIAQVQLAQKYGLGVTPVREALQRLVQEGFVQAIPRFGYIVAQVTFADVAAIFEFRTILECAAARLAVERATDAQLSQLSESVHFTYVYHDKQSYIDFLNHNADFHQAIAVLARNQKLFDAMTATFAELTRLFHMGLDLRDSAEEMRAEHIALAKALSARDADRAVQILRSQIGRSQERVMEALTGSGGSSLAGSMFRRHVQIEPVDSPLGE
jgi:DNA-binding GntR family transcriptional regulator